MFSTYRNRAYITIWSRLTKHDNEDFHNEEWHCLEEWCVIAGFRSAKDPWFNIELFGYDGMYTRYVTVFGIIFGFGYSYEVAS